MLGLYKEIYKSYILFLLLLSTCILTINAAQINPSQNNQYLTEQERIWIEEHPILRVHNERNWAPFNFHTKGTAAGFSIEYMNLLADKAGFKVDYINGPSWNEFLGMMKAGQLDVMLNIVQTNERNQYLQFTSPYSIVSPVLAIRNEDKDIFSLDNIGDKTLCLPKGSSTHEYLTINRPQIKLRPLEDALACLRAVQNHQVDFALDGDAILNSIFSMNNIKGLRISKVAVDPEMASVLRIATSKDSSILRDILDKTIQQLDDSKVSQLHQKWLEPKQDSTLEKKPTDIALYDEAELSWIKSNPIVRVGNEMDWAPFDFVDKNQPQGVAIDLMQIIAEKSGLEMEFINGYSWDELLIMFKNKELDVLPALLMNPEREKFTLFTKPYFVNRTVIVTREEDKKTKTLKSLAGKKVAIVSGYGYESLVKSSFPEIDVISVSSFIKGLESVLDKSVDAFIGSRTVVSYTMTKNLIYGLHIAGPSGVDDPAYTNLSIGVRNDYLILHSIIEKTLTSLSEDEISLLLNKWMPSAKSDVTATVTDDYLSDVATVALLIIVLMLLMTYFSKKMALSNKGNLQTGTRQFRVLLLIIMSVFLGSISILGWIEMGNIKSKILMNLENNLNSILVTTVERLDNWVDQEQFSLEQIANNSDLAIETEKLLKLEQSKAVLVASKEQRKIREILKPSSKSLGLGYFIINKAGVSIASRRDSNIGTINLIALQRSELLKNVFEGQSIFIPPVYSDVTDANHHSSLFIAVPIKNKAEEVIAVLTKRLNAADKFSQVLQYSRVGESGESYAFDNKGTLLSVSRFEEHLRELGLIKNDQSSLMNIQIRDPGVNLLETNQQNRNQNLPLTVMAESAIKMSLSSSVSEDEVGQVVKSNLEGYRDYRGVPVVGAWLWDYQLGMGLTSEMDLEEALSIYNTIKIATILVFSITLFFIIAGTFFILIMGERTSRLAKRTKKELEYQVEVRTKDLKISEEKSNSIVTNASDAIITINEQQEIIAFNPSSEKMFNYSAEEIMGKSIETLIPESARASHKNNVVGFEKEKTNTKNMKSREGIKGRRKNGELFPAEASISKSTIHGVTFFTAFVKDISDRVESENAMLLAREEAEAATVAKSDFLANMSHEIRTPMNAIIGLSDLALRTNLNSKQEDYLNKVHSSANALLGIINDILDFSKIEAGKLNMEEIEFSMDEVLENLATVVTVKTQEKGLELLFSRDSDVPVNLLGDPLRIGQILINLANNAVKFTDEGEIILSIKLVENISDKVTIRFCVEDSGIGMTEEQMGKLFKSFSQADSSTSRKYGGTGLGLSISKQLVEMMDGKIWINSELGNGSKFFFDLKLKINKKPSTKIKVLSSDLNNLKVLIVDDNPHAREILEKYLNDFGLGVDSVSSAEDAFEVLSGEAQPFDLVLMDFMMPNGMDGVSATKHIKQNLALEVIPKIILVTAYGYGDYADMDGVSLLDNELNKPVNPSLLLDAIMETFGHEIIGNSMGSRQSQGINHTELDKIRGARILLVEDNAINQQVATELLEAESFVVDIANNGKEATENFELNNYDCVLMDIQMPIMDGYTATRMIRENDNYVNLPILAMTANAAQEDKDKAIASGMNDHISKPVNPADLFNTLIKWIHPGDRELPVKSNYEQVTSAEDNTDELTSINGLSIDEGLKHVNGNKKLLKKLIIDFYNDYQTVLLTMKNDLAEGKLEEVQRTAHTLKGIAGTFGAESVQKCASELEQIIKNKQTELFESRLQDLTNVLQPLLAQLKIIIVDNKQPEDDSVAKELESPEKIDELMTLLTQSLEEMDPESEERAGELIKSLKGYNQNVLLTKLRKQVSSYEFDEAQSTLVLIKKNLSENKV